MSSPVRFVPLSIAVASLLGAGVLMFLGPGILSMVDVAALVYSAFLIAAMCLCLIIVSDLSVMRENAVDMLPHVIAVTLISPLMAAFWITVVKDITAVNPDSAWLDFTIVPLPAVIIVSWCLGGVLLFRAPKKKK